MAYHDSKFAAQYTDLIATFKAAFPDIDPPDSTWFAKWLREYRFGAIRDAIQTLATHPMKARFTTDSTGKAISALLREDALRRAVVSPVKAVR
jgi:hypothetical protein